LLFYSRDFNRWKKNIEQTKEISVLEEIASLLTAFAPRNDGENWTLFLFLPDR